jgi:hypothetical protein
MHGGGAGHGGLDDTRGLWVQTAADATK